jgi:hypothetical protein|tara:strand:- start:43 stop:318 length:276 start_codon:yes stop_codon:yes gene_type:complete
MWKIYKWDGHYIQGEFISEHTTEAAALKKAKKTIKYLKATKRTSTGPSDVGGKKEIIIWLNGDGGLPLGMITKKINKKTKENKGDAKVSTE